MDDATGQLVAGRAWCADSPEIQADVKAPACASLPLCTGFVGEALDGRRAALGPVMETEDGPHLIRIPPASDHVGVEVCVVDISGAPLPNSTIHLADLSENHTGSDSCAEFNVHRSGAFLTVTNPSHGTWREYVRPRDGETIVARLGELKERTVTCHLDGVPCGGQAVLYLYPEGHNCTSVGAGEWTCNATDYTELFVSFVEDPLLRASVAFGTREALTVDLYTPAAKACLVERPGRRLRDPDAPTLFTSDDGEYQSEGAFFQARLPESGEIESVVVYPADSAGISGTCAFGGQAHPCTTTPWQAPCDR